MARPRAGRFLALGALLGVALFWLGVFAGGALISGYHARADYISSIASRGSPVAPIGIGAIASMGLAYASAGAFVRRAWGRASLAAALVLAGVSQLVVAAFRIRCPLGAAGCRFEAALVVHDAFDALHRDGVLAFELCLLVAMLILAAGAMRGAPWPRWLGVVSVPLGIASVYLLARTGGVDNGLWQRSWAAVNSAWLVMVVGAGAGWWGRDAAG